MSERTGSPPRTNFDDEHNLVHFSCLGNSSQSAAPIKFSDIEEGHHDLIAFLAIAQKNRIDLLPFTWNPALDTVGRGGTAEIRQSQIRLQQSFAFKRFEPSMGKSSEDTTFKALISEISVLGHPSIKTHPNIIALYGICWDVLPEGMVWPVLVFEKASMGNLKEFIRSGEGKSIAFADKLKICADISSGIRDMHANSQCSRICSPL